MKNQQIAPQESTEYTQIVIGEFPSYAVNALQAEANAIGRSLQDHCLEILSAHVAPEEGVQA